MNTLVAGQPKLADNKASTAMDALLNATDPAAAPVHAVVTTEQQLFQRAASLPDAKNMVASWLPPGPTADGRLPDGAAQRQLAVPGTGQRGQRIRPVHAQARTARGAGQGRLPHRGRHAAEERRDELCAGVGAAVGGRRAMRATLANTLTAPVESPAVTIMLDQSMPTEEGGKSRLANVVAALNARLQALPPSSAVGLWTFDGVEGRSEVRDRPAVRSGRRQAALGGR